MKQTKRFAVVGSDARQAAAGRALARAGYTVGGVQQLPQADYILLPLPLEQSGLPLAQLLGAAKPGALALGGKVTDGAIAIARAAGVELVDYFARPELTPRAASAFCWNGAAVPCGAQRCWCWVLARWGGRWRCVWRRWARG